MVVKYIAVFLIFFATNSYSENSHNINDLRIKFYTLGIEQPTPVIQIKQRQLITVDITFLSSDEFSYLRTDKYNIKDYIIESKLVANEASSSSNLFIKHMRIFIWPLSSGEQVLDLPKLTLLSSGREISSIALPMLTLNVISLPDYLPPGFPVGEISLKSKYSHNDSFITLTKPNAFTTLILTTTTKGLHPTLISDYYNYLQSNSIIHLPATKLKETSSNDLEYSYSRSANIPVLSKLSGLHEFEVIKLLSFNPKTEKVASYQYEAPTLIVFNKYIQSLLVIILVFLLYKITKAVLRTISNILARRDIWLKIYDSKNTKELSTSLRRLAPKIETINNHNLTLRSWSRLWCSPLLESNIDSLISDQFSDSRTKDYDELKSKIIMQLRIKENLIFYAFLKAK